MKISDSLKKKSENIAIKNNTCHKARYFSSSKTVKLMLKGETINCMANANTRILEYSPDFVHVEEKRKPNISGPQNAIAITKGSIIKVKKRLVFKMFFVSICLFFLLSLNSFNNTWVREAVMKAMGTAKI